MIITSERGFIFGFEDDFDVEESSVQEDAVGVLWVVVVAVDELLHFEEGFVLVELPADGSVDGLALLLRRGGVRRGGLCRFHVAALGRRGAVRRVE